LIDNLTVEDLYLLKTEKMQSIINYSNGVSFLISLLIYRLLPLPLQETYMFISYI